MKHLKMGLASDVSLDEFIVYWAESRAGFAEVP